MLLDRVDSADRTQTVPKPAEKVNPAEKAPEHVTNPPGNGYAAGNLNFDASVMRYRTERLYYNPPRVNPPALTFTDDKGIAEPADPLYRTSGPGPHTFDSPEEYAKYIKYGLALGDPSQSDHFVGALQEHKNDTEWTQRFFKALGAQETARLISVANEVVHDGISSRVVGEALSNLVRDGRFNQSDMNTLVRNMASNAPYSTFRDVSAIFDNLPNSSEGKSLKNMFGQSAVSLMAGTGDFKGTNYSDTVKNTFAAIATRTLASTDQLNQVTQLNEWRKAVGNAAFSEFIKGSMSAYPLSPDDVDTGKITQLFDSVINAAPHYAGSTLTQSLIPLDELRELQSSMFQGAVKSFNDERVFESYKNNVGLKDSLSKLFMSDFDEIMTDSLATNQARLNDGDFQRGMGKFFQLALFTHHANQTSEALSQFLINKLSALKNGLLDTSGDADQKFQKMFGINREDGAAFAGLMLGMMTQGIRGAKADLEKDAERKAEAIGLFIDIGLSLVPKAGNALTSGVEKGIVRDLLQGSADVLQGEITGDLKKGLIDDAKKAFANALQGKDLVQIMAGIYYAFDGQLPNENPDLLVQFEGAYRSVVTDVPPDQS
jgi:hypothetical protein